MSERVASARERQHVRARRLGIAPVENARLRGDDLKRAVELDEKGAELLEQAVVQLSLSARVYHRVLRVARSAADLDGEERVRAAHIDEAIRGRLLDREHLA